jgi:hypothetical protein
MQWKNLTLKEIIQQRTVYNFYGSIKQWNKEIMITPFKPGVLNPWTAWGLPTYFMWPMYILETCIKKKVTVKIKYLFLSE